MAAGIGRQPSANLSDANLTQAMMKWTNLTGADATEANLCMVKLDRAGLSLADRSIARLEGVVLDSARLRETVLPDGSIANDGC